MRHNAEYKLIQILNVSKPHNNNFATKICLHRNHSSISFSTIIFTTSAIIITLESLPYTEPSATIPSKTIPTEPLETLFHNLQNPSDDITIMDTTQAENPGKKGTLSEM